MHHLQSQPAPTQPGDSGVSFPPEDELPVVAALEKALGMPVKAVQGTTAAPSGIRGLILRLTLESKTGTSWWLGNQSAVCWPCPPQGDQPGMCRHNHDPFLTAVF